MMLPVTRPRERASGGRRRSSHRYGQTHISGYLVEQIDLAMQIIGTLQREALQYIVVIALPQHVMQGEVRREATTIFDMFLCYFAAALL